MSDTLVTAIAQLDPTLGDIAGNIEKLRRARAEAVRLGADLLVGTELCVAGYPPEDLVLKPAFLEACEAAVRDFARETTTGPAVLLGAPWREGGKTYNAALLLDRGEIAAVRLKHELPNYGVFDEKRVFAAGPAPGPVAFRGIRLGIMVCEDMWLPDVTETLAETGAELLIVINGSPFEHEKRDERVQLACARITESGLPLLYVNQLGGQDELVFEGGSFALDAQCRLCLQAPDWREAVLPLRWWRNAEDRWTIETGALEPPVGGLEAVYQAMMLGLRDYVEKNHFPGIVLGLSGGIDSALSAAVAVDALGAGMVHCVMMPSPYTSRESLEDAAEVARLLGAPLSEIGIGPAMAAYETMLAPAFAGRQGVPADVPFARLVLHQFVERFWATISRRMERTRLKREARR